jgi:transcriptional regulator with PAS, ATPase and Fis domain
MSTQPWIEAFPGAVTVCDAEGIILEMNEAAAQAFQAEGGKALVGQNVLACHPEPARSKLQAMMAEQRKNVYTIEKKGVKKLVYQVPWYKDGVYAGFVELVLEIPTEMPHFNRDLKKTP